MPGPYSAAITFSLYTIPQRVVQHFRFGMADALDLLEIGDGGSLDGGDGLEVRQQRGARLFTDAGNGGQGGGVGFFLHCALAVVVGVAVGLVLNVRDKRKDIAVAVDGDLAALVTYQLYFDLL